MKILVTGAAGFAGRHLIRELTDHGHTPLAYHRDSASVLSGMDTIKGDICDSASVRDAVSHTKPDACIHLAAMTFVPDGASDPAQMFAVNVTGTLHLLQAIKDCSPDTRTLVISTSHVYGHGTDQEPLNEDAAMAPDSLYAVSKAAADLTALAYANQFNLPIMTARPSNHTGPDQPPRFSVPAFASQVKAMAMGKTPATLRVGNLESLRTFSDVRDVVRAYRLLVEKGHSGRAYNICSHFRISMATVVSDLCKLAGVNPEITVDPDKVRPANSVPLLDTSRLEQDTGWKPQIDFQQTLGDVLESFPA